MFEFDFSFALGFVAGGALIWFSKTRIQQLVIGANAVSAKLHAEADSVAAAIKKV
jgi:hypothetical protein